MSNTLYTLPVWRWPDMRTYNGFTHIERVRGWQWQVWAERVGLIKRTQFCCITGRRLDSREVQLHLEDYYRPWEIFPVCKEAHRLLHSRFTNPNAWNSFIDMYRGSLFNEQHWFETISCSPVDIAATERKQLPGIEDVFKGPEFRRMYPNFPEVFYPDFSNLV